MKKTKSPALQLARSQTSGAIVSIFEVPTGKACDCVSLGCNRPLVARNRGKSPGKEVGVKERIAHFALYNPGTTEQEPSPESAIHLLAKEVFASSRRLVLPMDPERDAAHWLWDTDDIFSEMESELDLPAHTDWRELRELRERIQAETFQPFEAWHERMAHRTTCEAVSLEHRVETPEGPVVVDALVTYADGAQLAVEFRNTHAVDADKQAKFSSAHLSCVEIDISSLPALTPDGRPNRPAILDLLTSDKLREKRWVHENGRSNRRAQCLAPFRHKAELELKDLRTRLRLEIDVNHFFRMRRKGFQPRKISEYFNKQGFFIREVFCPQSEGFRVCPESACLNCPSYGGLNLYEKPISAGKNRSVKSVLCSET